MKTENVFLCIVSILMLSGCRSRTGDSVPSAESVGERKVTDLYGREITLPEDAIDRPVCIGAGALRLYSYVGDVSRLAGVEAIEKQDNVFNGVIRPYREINKDVFASLPSCGKGGPQNQVAEPEAILSCNPSIVISEYTDIEAMDELQNKLGVPVVMVSYGKQLGIDSKISDSITLLGDIFNQKERAATLFNFIDGLKSDLRERTKDIREEDKKSVYLGCLGNYGIQDIYSTSYAFSLMNLSGIRNVMDDATDPKTGYTSVDKEAFQKLNMDKIILDAAGLSRFRTTYRENPALFDDIPAIRNGEVYLQMPFNAYFTNIEVAYCDAYFEAKVAYPEQFRDVDMAAKSNEITKAFLGVEYYDTIASWHNGGYQQIRDLKEFFSD